MAIRIVRNEQGNCINFYGSSNPTYWNACLSAEVDSLDNNSINIINDIITSQTGTTQYEFFRIPYTEFVDAQGNGFASAQIAADYITDQANVVGLGGGGTDLTGETVCFKLDDTTTSIMLDTGHSYGVNTLKAIDTGDANITIQSKLGDIVYFTNLSHGNVCNGDGDSIPGGLNDVIDYLNELFTVGAFEAVVITDPEATTIADVSGLTDSGTLVGSNIIDPIGQDILGTTATHNNAAGYLSGATINQAGEYYTFDIAGKATYGFGLVHTQASYDAGYYSGNASYADPTGFCVGANSSHLGYQFAHHFHVGNAHASWTNYGANTAYNMGEAWYDHNNRFDLKEEWNNGDPVKVKVGINELGFITISTLNDDGINWRLHARSSYPVPQGSSFKLGVKLQTTAARLRTQPKVHYLAVDDAPTTIGDTSISTFGDNVSGTLADGIVVTTSSDDNDGFVSSEVINTSGEYFEFTWSEGDSHVGLFSENDFDIATVQGDTSAWGNDDYIFFGHRAEDNGSFGSIYRDASGTNIGYTSTGGSTTGSFRGRAGFDNQGRPTLWYSLDGVTWNVRIQGGSAAPSGDYKFIFIAQSNGADLSSLTKGQLTQAPVMNFRYIESPDGTFQYPLFATAEEANYYDANHTIGSPGSGTSHTHVYVDDPTSTTWYMADTGSTMTDNQDPIGTTFNGQVINYTEITSLRNADLVPTAFTDTTITVNELSSVNYQVSPVDVGYTTTIGGTPNWSLSGGTTITGTAPEVTGDNVANPSDTTTITVYRTNSYGTSSGTLTINITNLTAPVVTPITGVTHEGGTAMIDSDTMADGSVVSIDETVGNGERFVIDKEWLDNYVLPKITSGSGAKSVWIGFEAQGVTNDYTSITNADFRVAYEFYCDDASRAANNWRLKTHNQGVSYANVGVGGLTSGLYDYVFINEGDTLRASALVASQGHDASTKIFDANSGDWNWSLYKDSSVGSHKMIIATVGTDLDLDLGNFSEYTEPVAPVLLTPWTKALDFSGSNEHLKQVGTSMYDQPLQMNGLANTVGLGTRSQGETSDSSTSRPWATAVVFKSDGYNANQIIWNQGEGYSSGNDNIYLKVTSSGDLMFGWGRQGTGFNECRLAQNISSSTWYGAYVAHSGVRLSGNNASAANLANCFDIRLMSSADSFSSLSSNLSIASNWILTGYRMDRTVAGNFTIGGSGTSSFLSYRGKVASMIVTTLIGSGSFTPAQQPGGLMYNDAQIETMITDPVTWIADYKARHGTYNTSGPYRPPASRYTLQPFLTGNQSSAYRATQVWLMGDGASDSYSNGVRNYVYSADQNRSKLQLNSMVSNDIQNVTITGLS